MAKQFRDNTALTNRLRRIEGQVRGVARMVAENKSCEDILIQISSIKASLHKTGQIILEAHISHCVLEGIRKGKGEEAVKKMSPAIGQFSKII